MSATAAARSSRSAAQRQIYVFATLEPSIAAYHLAFGPDDYLYVTGPTTSSFDCVHRVSPDGEVEIFYRGLGTPARHGVRRRRHGCTSPRRWPAAAVSSASIRIATPSCSSPDRISSVWRSRRRAALMVATSNALYRVDVNIAGRPLP